ncbi:MAG: hypothetical protein ISS23_01505 [Nanoarchaeota archaeon]|nr:hypothetical protein [Nanoarchaeota archaeon]
MKNKVLSMFLLVVFLVSLLPATLAQNDLTSVNGANNGRNTDSANTNSANNIGETELKRQISAKKPISAGIQAAKRNLQNITAKRALIKVRQVNTELVKRYAAIKGEFIKARELQKTARAKFVNAKQMLKTCQEDTEGCVQVRQNIRTGAVNFLGNSADAIIRHLEKIKNKIQTNPRLTEEEVDDIVSEIDAKIQEIEDAKAQIESAETKEEIVASAKVINAAWKPIKNRATYWAGRLINAKMGGIIVKIEHLESRLRLAVEKMEEQGKDVSGIEPMIDEFHELLVSAKGHFDLAVENYKQFKETDDKTYLNEGKKEMDLARQDLNAAHKKLKEIVRTIKSSRGTDELGEATEEMPIEEIEDEA